MSQGREDNNINLLRLLAASAVVVAHCGPIIEGPFERLEPWLGVTLGEAAVHVFFVLSGLLVTRSALEKDWRSFAVARARRIYPAAIVSALATVVVTGLLFSGASVADFFINPLTIAYIVQNTTLVSGVLFTLPAAFESNPYAGAVNGSLWSIAVELQIYVVIGLLVAAVRLWASRTPRVLVLALCLAAALAPAALALTAIPGLQQPVARCALFFFMGAFVHARWAGRLPAKACLVGIGTLMLIWPETRFLGYALSLTALVLWLAYAGTPIGRPWARWPDLSYGIYLYGFPVQQAVMATVPGLGVWTLLLGTAVALIPIAAASWYLVELPWLTARRPRAVEAAAVPTPAPAPAPRLEAMP